MPVSGELPGVTAELSRFRLRFPAPVEREFADFMRQSGRGPALALLMVAFLAFAMFAALDFYRFAGLRHMPEVAAAFYAGIVLPRCLSLVGMLFVATVLYFRWLPRFTVHLSVGVFLLIGLTIFVTTAVYARLGLPRATSSYVVVVAAVFLPCGLLFRQALAVGIVLLASALAIAHWGLVPEPLEPLWLFMVIVAVSFAVSSVSAYTRERAQRAQFLLRKIVAWEASHDSLTGLLNRRAFFEAAGKLQAQAAREGGVLAMAVIDIDHFKGFNDRYGHAEGDKALLAVAEQLRVCARRHGDLVVRLGGEEFGVLGYGKHAASLSERVQQCLSDVAGLRLPHESSPTASYLTFSAGVAQLRPGDDGIVGLYRRADESLYLAKEQGRNCVLAQRETADSA